MGCQISLYCQDCRQNVHLEKWCSDLAEAAVRSVAAVKKLYKNYRDHTKWKYNNAKSFAIEHTEKGHHVLVIYD